MTGLITGIVLWIIGALYCNYNAKKTNNSFLQYIEYTANIDVIILFVGIVITMLSLLFKLLIV